MLGIRRLIVVLESERIPVSSSPGGALPIDVGQAFQHAALLSAACQLPLAVALLHPSDQPFAGPAQVTTPTQPVSSVDLLSQLRPLINQQAHRAGSSVSEFECFTTTEWTDLLTSTPCDPGLLFSLTVPDSTTPDSTMAPAPQTSLVFPRQTGWRSALQNFPGYLWLHPTTPANPESSLMAPTDVVALVSCQQSPLQTLIDAVAIAKALHVKFHVRPCTSTTGKFTPNETIEQVIHESLAQCDYRTLPQGLRVYPVADSPVEALQQTSHECSAPLVLFPRTTLVDDTVTNMLVANMLNPARGIPAGSLLLLPEESARSSQPPQ